MIRDGDTKFTQQFDQILKDAGVKPLKLPPRSPNLNAYAERFVKSVKTECTDKMIFFGMRSLCKALNEYVAHYHAERNHQGLGNRLIESDESVGSTTGEILCKERLGGMLNTTTAKPREFVKFGF